MVWREASLARASRGYTTARIMRSWLLLVIFGIFLSCEAYIHGEDNVQKVATGHSDAAHDNVINTANVISITERPKMNTTPKVKVKELYRSVLDELDLPIDAFTLHHPFAHSSITEFEYSQWYFLFSIYIFGLEFWTRTF